MKKFILLGAILLVSFFCTACINNLAIQELSEMGLEYLEKGDYDSAIARFQSCVDLDDNIFETRYNLATAYIRKEDFANAVKLLSGTTKKFPDKADGVYLYAVALEGLGFEFQNAQQDNDEPSLNLSVNPKVSKEEVASSLENLSLAVSMFDKYSEMAPDAKDIESVKAHIGTLKSKISGYCSEYNLQDSPACAAM